jgi:Peptidase family M28
VNSRTRIVCSAIALALVFGTGMLAIGRAQGVHGDTKPSSIGTSIAAPIPLQELIRGMLGQVNKDRIVTDLRRLSGEEPICIRTGCASAANRRTGSAGLSLAMDYIDEGLTGRGYSLEFRNWSRDGESDRNLIVRKEGVAAPADEIYLVAHVDGVKPSGGERFPAADDNGSGAVDLLEVGRILSSYSFSRTLVLLFSTGEEQGTLGVTSYLAQLPSAELRRIKTVVNVDMVGYDANRDGHMQLWHGDHPPSLAVTQVMSKTIRTYGLNLAPSLIAGCG